MGISKFNKGNKIDWGIDTKSLPFKKTSEVELNKTYDLKGCFITPDRGFGGGAVLITDDFLLNIPGRYIDNINNIMSDPETVEDIKAGKYREYRYASAFETPQTFWDYITSEELGIKN